MLPNGSIPKDTVTWEAGITEVLGTRSITAYYDWFPVKRIRLPLTRFFRGQFTDSLTGMDHCRAGWGILQLWARKGAIASSVKPHIWWKTILILNSKLQNAPVLSLQCDTVIPISFLHTLHCFLGKNAVQWAEHTPCRKKDPALIPAISSLQNST